MQHYLHLRNSCLNHFEQAHFMAFSRHRSHDERNIIIFFLRVSKILWLIPSVAPPPSFQHEGFQICMVNRISRTTHMNTTSPKSSSSVKSTGLSYPTKSVEMPCSHFYLEVDVIGVSLREYEFPEGYPHLAIWLFQKSTPNRLHLLWFCCFLGQQLKLWWAKLQQSHHFIQHKISCAKNTKTLQNGISWKLPFYSQGICLQAIRLIICTYFNIAFSKHL